MPETIVTIPCFNEEKRLSGDEFLRLAAQAEIGLLFVDDGSTDGTRNVLEGVRARGGSRIDVLSLEKNRGKAEAVRAGLRASLDRGSSCVGYVDADLATPVAEIVRLVREIDQGRFDVVMGARVALLGNNIERSATRHYLGRVFATVASGFLGIRVYDTQCGAKFFRRTPALEQALAAPFRSRWAFDVELIGRLRNPDSVAPVAADRFLEVPLQAWRDVRGSKLRGLAMARAGADLLTIGARLALASRRRRNSVGE